MTGPGMRRAATWTGMRAAPDPSFLGPLRRRRWRRALVGVVCMLWAVTLVGWLVPPVMLPFWGWVGSVPLTAVAILVLALATRNVSASVDAFVDERDREVRDRSNRIAYWAFGAPFAALVGGAYNLVHRRTEDGLVTMTAGEVSVILAATVTLALCYLVLPTAIIAWTEPDPLADEEG